MKDQAAEATIAAVAQKVTVGGAGWAFFGGVTANTVAALGGLAIAFVGLLVQVYYKRKADKRAEELHRFRLSGEDEG